MRVPATRPGKGEAMTHPDILKIERTGCLHDQEPPVCIGVCEYCGARIYDDGLERVESPEGMFCDMDCCCGYYEIVTV